MDIAITGASGFIGTALGTSLSAAGHTVIPVVRSKPTTDQIGWDPAAGRIDAEAFEGLDAVVHLAGAGIGDKRWTTAYKQTILDSRTGPTELLARTLAGLQRPPEVLACASAIGYYGNRGDELITEESSRGEGFLSDVVVAWETATTPASQAGIRTVLLRSGIVLHPRGGTLRRQLPLFKVGFGGRFGNGRQWQSWIGLHDHLAAVAHVLSPGVSGPVNLTAPAPVTNAEFTRVLGTVLRRPTALPVPLFGPRLLFGRELVESLILEGQRVLPAVLERSGFSFVSPELEGCLRYLLSRPVRAEDAGTA